MKMASSKRLLLILCAGIFFAGLIGLGGAYLGQVQEQKQLSENLASVEEQTAGISTENILYQQSVDRDRIAQLEKQVTAARTQLTASLVVSNIFQELLEVATDTGVGITDIGSSVLTKVEIAGVPYRAMSVDFIVAGRASNVYSFVDTVSQTSRTYVLKALKVDIQENAALGLRAGSTADMRLTIYSYEGGHDY